MNNILDNFPDIKDLMNIRQVTESVPDEKPQQKFNSSITSKITKHLFFQNSRSHGSDPIFLKKVPQNTDPPIQSGEVFRQITLRYIHNFFELLLNKFKKELEFLTDNAETISTFHSDTIVTDPELATVKNMIYFDSFVLVNRKENPSFYKIDAILSRFDSIISVLEQAIQALSKENPARIMAFFDEAECQKSFRKTLPLKLFENTYFTKTCSTLWTFMNRQKFAEANDCNIQLTFENLKLFLFGISFPSPHMEEYPLHKAVFGSNLAMIRRICAREKSPVFHAHIEQSDPLGVTPLMLAVLLGNKDAVLALTNLGANPKHRSYPYARTPLEEAICQKNRGIIKILVLASTYIKQAYWAENKKSLIKSLAKMPDFSFEMNWECDSKIIPFVKKVAPSDTYKVYKRGSSIRIDLSLLGWSKLKSVRGNSSIIFNGLGAEEGKLLMVDHIKKTSVDILTEMNVLLLENKVDELLKHEQIKSEVRAENVVFKPVTTWKGDNARAQVNGYDCTKCVAKGTFSLLFTRRNVLVEVEAKAFDSYDHYFDQVVHEPLWIIEQKTGKIDWNISPILLINQYSDQYQAIVKTLFEKDGKEDLTSSLSRERMCKETEKLNISQKKLLKNYTKNIVATIYMCDNFPLKLENFFPILEILSNVSPHIYRLKGFLEKTLSVDKNSFPIKASIPIFFSLNAVLSITNFKFTPLEAPLFDLEVILQRKSKKITDSILRDEKFRTEIGSDDEHIQQRWEELLKQDSDDEDTSYSSKNVMKKEIKPKKEEHAPADRRESFYQSFFKKTLDDSSNQDLVDVFAADKNDDDDAEDLEDSEISEKFRNETLKMSSHGTAAPKTKTSLHEKFRFMFNKTEPERTSNYGRGAQNLGELNFRQALPVKKGDNIHSLKEKSSYKFMQNLNGRSSNTRQTQPNDVAVRNYSEPETSECSSRDLNSKKLMKYARKKHNLFSKPMVAIEEISFKDENMDPELNIPREFEGIGSRRSSKILKHDRIKSLDFPAKMMNSETFYENLVKRNE